MHLLFSKIPDDMTLEQARDRSAYLMRSKRAPRRVFSPSDYDAKGKNNVGEEERPRRSVAGRRMRFNMDDEEEESGDEVEEEEEEPQPVRRKKIPVSRGGGRAKARGRK